MVWNTLFLQVDIHVQAKNKHDYDDVAFSVRIAKFMLLLLIFNACVKPGFHPNATHATQAIAFGWKPGLRLY